MKEVAESHAGTANPPSPSETPTPTLHPMNLFPLHPHLQQLKQQQQQQQQVQQLPLQFRSVLQLGMPQQAADNVNVMSTPFPSYSALLTEGNGQEPEDYGPITIRHLCEQIERVAKANSEHVKRMMFDIWRNHYNNLLRMAYDEAGQKVKEKDDELNQVLQKNNALEQSMTHLRYHCQMLEGQVKNLEQVTASLRTSLQEATLRGASAAAGGSRAGGLRALQEDAESSFVDQDRVAAEPTQMTACKACGKGVATVLIWHCRHVSICRRCDATIKTCPVCLGPKMNSVEVLLP